MLNERIIEECRKAFVKNCVILVGRAYDELRAKDIVNRDMNENTVSENLRRLMCQDPFSYSSGIMVAREQPVDDTVLLASNCSADSLPRIDFKFQQSWSRRQKMLEFYMEAKNLYGCDFIKTGNRSVTSANACHKRYVKTGIIHLLDGYYPHDTYLLGYLLDGIVQDAVTGINKHIISMLSQAEVLNPEHQSLYPSISSYVSYHSQDRKINHLILRF